MKSKALILLSLMIFVGKPMEVSEQDIFNKKILSVEDFIERNDENFTKEKFNAIFKSDHFSSKIFEKENDEIQLSQEKDDLEKFEEDNLHGKFELLTQNCGKNLDTSKQVEFSYDKRLWKIFKENLDLSSDKQDLQSDCISHYALKQFNIALVEKNRLLASPVTKTLNFQDPQVNKFSNVLDTLVAEEIKMLLPYEIDDFRFELSITFYETLKKTIHSNLKNNIEGDESYSIKFINLKERVQYIAMKTFLEIGFQEYKIVRYKILNVKKVSTEYGQSLIFTYYYFLNLIGIAKDNMQTNEFQCFKDLPLFYVERKILHNLEDALNFYAHHENNKILAQILNIIKKHCTQKQIMLNFSSEFDDSIDNQEARGQCNKICIII